MDQQTAQYQAQQNALQYQDLFKHQQPLASTSQLQQPGMPSAFSQLGHPSHSFAPQRAQDGFGAGRGELPLPLPDEVEPARLPSLSTRDRRRPGTGKNSNYTPSPSRFSCRSSEWERRRSDSDGVEADGWTVRPATAGDPQRQGEQHDELVHHPAQLESAHPRGTAGSSLPSSLL